MELSNCGSIIWGKWCVGDIVIYTQHLITQAPLVPKGYCQCYSWFHICVHTHISYLWPHRSVSRLRPFMTAAAGFLLEMNYMYGCLGGPCPSRYGIIIHCNMRLRCDDGDISWSSTSLAVPKVPVDIPQAEVTHFCFWYDKWCHAGILSGYHSRRRNTVQNNGRKIKVFTHSCPSTS
jgi:hypothetical protein